MQFESKNEQYLPNWINFLHIRFGVQIDQKSFNLSNFIYRDSQICAEWCRDNLMHWIIVNDSHY